VKLCIPHRQADQPLPCPPSQTTATANAGLRAAGPGGAAGGPADEPPARAARVHPPLGGDGCGGRLQRGRHHGQADADRGGQQHLAPGGCAPRRTATALLPSPPRTPPRARHQRPQQATPCCSAAGRSNVASAPPLLSSWPARRPCLLAGPGAGAAHREHDGELGLPADPVRHVHQQRPARTVSHVPDAQQADEVRLGVGGAPGHGGGVHVGLFVGGAQACVQPCSPAQISCAATADHAAPLPPPPPPRPPLPRLLRGAGALCSA
jgi:hypothetical protein